MTIRWNLPITVERCISSTKEVCNNADSPDIDGLSMASLAEYSEAQVRNSVLSNRPKMVIIATYSGAIYEGVPQVVVSKFIAGSSSLHIVR